MTTIRLATSEDLRSITSQNLDQIMRLAHLALALVGAEQLTKATKPYVGPHAADFLKANPNYR